MRRLSSGVCGDILLNSGTLCRTSINPFLEFSMLNLFSILSMYNLWERPIYLLSISIDKISFHQPSRFEALHLPISTDLPFIDSLTAYGNYSLVGILQNRYLVGIHRFYFYLYSLQPSLGIDITFCFFIGGRINH